MRIESIQDEFDRHAEESPESVAISCAGKRLLYGELRDRSNNLANFLLASGAAKGDLVAVIVDDSIQVITALLAILKAGCVFVPLDPAAPGARLKQLASDIEPSWYLVESTLERRLVEIAEIIPSGKMLVLDQQPLVAEPLVGRVIPESYGDHWNPGKPSPRMEPDDLCYIYFTSGSTGRPKAIGGRFKAIGHFIGWEIEILKLESGARFSQLTTPVFDAFLRDVFTPLCSGGRLCVPPSRETVLDARRLVEWLGAEAVNFVHCVPSLFRSISGQVLSSDQLRSLTAVLLAGEPLLPADVKNWMQLFGDRVQLINLYGSSETTMTKFYYFVKAADQDARAIPIGKPMPGARAVLVDSRGRSLAPGLVGEIYIRTPFRSLGYYNQPELTREVFIPNPFSNNPEDIVYKTGDYGRQLEDGNFEFLGRKDRQVKIRGVRIELAEIESALLEHQEITEVAVVDRADVEGNKYLCAYYISAREIEVSELLDFCAVRLMESHFPSAYVRLERLPRTFTGKLDRGALPDPATTRSRDEYVAPRTPVEEVLASIWSKVLNVERIGVHDNFFTLGGHSLLATRVLSRVSGTIRVDVPLRGLFEAPTLAAFAAKIDEALRAEDQLVAPRIVPVSRDHGAPLSFAQQRLWFLHQLDPASAAYNLPSAALLSGSLNLAVLERTLNEVIRRHEVLRTTFVEGDEGAVQNVSEYRPQPLCMVDLTGLHTAARTSESERLAREENLTPFDLGRGPMLRTRLLRMQADEHIVLFTVHHIASDAWSYGVLMREVTMLYKAFSAGESSPLRELEVQYADFAVWQRQWLRGRVLDAHLSYWKRHLGGNLPVMKLPLDRPRGSDGPGRLGSDSRRLSEDLTSKVETVSRAEGVTLFMTLLAAFLVVLHRASGQVDLVVGTDVANRNRLETEGMIGFFVNQLVLRTNLSGNPTMRELLGRVREVCLGAHAHQDLPFEKLVEVLNPDRDSETSPLFQVKIVFQNVPEEDLAIPGLEVSRVGLLDRLAKFDLLLEAIETPLGLVIRLDYNSDLFDAITIGALQDHLEEVIDRIAEEPDVDLQKLVEELEELEREKRKLRRRDFRAARFEKLKQARHKLTHQGAEQ